MPFVEAKCTNCGAHLTVDNTKDAAICQYCGTPFIVEKAINHYHTTNQISGSVVNIYGGNYIDFVIHAGKLVRYQGSATDVTIPDTVSIIGKESFNRCEGLRSVHIPNSVTRIESKAFAETGITEIQIPESVTFLGTGVFSDCHDLVNITLPKHFIDERIERFRLHGLSIPDQTFIPERLFFNCTKLLSVNLPNDVGYIGDSAFQNCRNLNLRLPSSVFGLGDSAFAGCSNLTEVTLPSGMKSIGEYAFRSCTSLLNVSIPKGVTSISKGLFCYCNKLKSIQMHSEVNMIGDQAFSGCSSLYNIIIPSKVRSIGYGAFEGCKELTSIVLPIGITKIGQCAFKNCVNLGDFSIPDSVTDITPSAFEGCRSIRLKASRAWKKQNSNIHPSFAEERDARILTKKIFGILIFLFGIGFLVSSCAQHGIENEGFWGGLIGLFIGFVGGCVYLFAEESEAND